MNFINEIDSIGTATIMLINAECIDGVNFYNSQALIAFEHVSGGIPTVYVEVNGKPVYDREHYGTCNRKEVFINGLNALFKALKRQGIEWRF